MSDQFVYRTHYEYECERCGHEVKTDVKPSPLAPGLYCQLCTASYEELMKRWTDALQKWKAGE